MRGATTDSKASRSLSSRRLCDSIPLHEEAAQEYRSDLPKAPTPPTNRPSSALKSIGHRLIHDELVSDEANERDASSKATIPLTSRPSPLRPSARFQVVIDSETTTSKDEFPSTSSRISTPSSPSQHFNPHVPDGENPINVKQEPPTRNTNGSSRPSSAAQISGRLQVHEDVMSTSTQEIPTMLPNRSRPSSPLVDLQVDNIESRIKNEEIPMRKAPLSPIRKLSDRIKLHDDGALGNRIDISLKMVSSTLPSRRLSDRLQIHDVVKRDSSASLSKDSVPLAPGVIDTGDTKDQEVKPFQDHHDEAQQADPEHTSESRDVPTLLATEQATPSPQSRFVPLHSQWTYGQRVFGRYRKTSYFYSGNIATYLGAGMFMIVFDDGSLDYRVRREDIMLREKLSPPFPSSQQNSLETERVNNSAKASADTKLRRRSLHSQEQENDDPCLGLSTAPEFHLQPLQHVMVDFSVTPPREIVLSFDDGRGYESGCPPCSPTGTDMDTWRVLLEDDTLTMKRLECGVGYEDDSTQVSDSDESSEEDMSMTPWQQMTQTFGMGKASRAQRGTGRRRSSVSSISQIERLSVTHKGMQQNIPSRRSLKQIIMDYFMRGNKKVQPSKVTEELALAEHIRLMEAKLSSMRSIRCHSGSPIIFPRGDSSLRVVYERAPDGVRAYGTIAKQVEDGSYAVLTEDEHSISVQVVPKDDVDLLPSVCELEQQLTDLERTRRVLFAGQKVQVSLYPGSRFSGRGLITLEREYQSRFHVLLANRIRLVNVPADKISPLREKKKAAVSITEDQFLLCNKIKVYIGDQICVKFPAENGELEEEEEKMGLLNGVYSNRTAAVDFADGSTGYEVPPHFIFKRKRVSLPADQDVRSLKNAVLMQASAAGIKGNLPVLEEGYQVKADHPRKAAVESCIVIKTHPSSACDLRFSDGTIAFEVFPSQMTIDSVEHQRTQIKATASLVTNESFNGARRVPTYAVGDIVLAWSSRYGRYCSAKILAKTSQDPTNAPETLSSPVVSTLSGVEALVYPVVYSVTMSVTAVPTSLYTLVFDYGEQKAQMPVDKITRLDDTTALSHTQRLTNYSIDTMGFELFPVNFTVGEAVMARVHRSARYFNGVVEAVNEKERVCAVCFDSSERDTCVPFSAMFSVDSRSHFSGRSTSTKQAGSGGSSSSETASRARFLARNRAIEEPPTASDTPTRPRRHSSGSVGNLLKSMDNFFRGSRSKPSLEPRRASHMITEIGARVRLPER